MPKLKTHKGTKKRINVTRTGKVMLRHASGNHLLSHKTASRKRTFAGVQELTGKSAKNMKLRIGA